MRRQSEHRADYVAALERLRDMGVLYRCFRTRKEVLEALAGAPQAGDAYDALAVDTATSDPDDEAIRLGRNQPFAWSLSLKAADAARLERGEPFAWRLSLKAAEARLGGFDRLTWVEEGKRAGVGVRAAAPWPFGDLVLGRKDIGAGYNIAVVVDDALQGVTHVVRGMDLAEVTSVHRVLQALLDLPTPIYRHHALIEDEHGKRLAKRTGAETLAALRERGVTAAEVRARLGFA